MAVRRSEDALPPDARTVRDAKMLSLSSRPMEPARIAEMEAWASRETMPETEMSAVSRVVLQVVEGGVGVGLPLEIVVDLLGRDEVDLPGMEAVGTEVQLDRW